ncbi:hypothetical protein GLAREA_00361 [Glarea lozoyensis ATCC 20868]|uniref:Golgi apparatus membrane protein TVP23 n=1 Tax=Glarea lozoyensis (strain ATCC 20868 / MF5171) TaxID=1116229 RepID=S3DB55_GLAL2|nr:uncharacterized protein GLAREA_00361 [Glarea lozoyensis ATCC 20868]EPE29201.1 hypothetical protein GLAREA_00361 [Glarea lozoyensis ATCC 20868]
MLLLAADFYYLKNIAGRRLVGLRWWNEVHPETGDSHWVFESSDPSTKVISATDRRFFWLALYSQPLLWVGLALVAIIRFEFIWLTLVGELPNMQLWEPNINAQIVIALSLTITNTLAFSRCDKFGQASNLAGSALLSGGMARSVTSGLLGRFFR